jgi:hypothetical protein
MRKFIEMRIKELETEDNSNIILMNSVELNGVSIENYYVY